MTKKQVKLGVKPMINLLESKQMDKISNMVKDGRFDTEAIKLLFNHKNMEVDTFLNIKDFCKFSDLFSSFEEFITSSFSECLYNNGETNAAFDWIEDYPATEDELISLYERNSECQDVIFKFFFYRVRQSTIPIALKQNYTNSLSGVYKLFLSRTGYSMGIDVRDITNNLLIQTMTEMYKWSQYISTDFIEFTEGLYGTSQTVEFVKTRIRHRRSGAVSPNSIADLEDLYDYLQENGEELFDLLYIIDPMCWLNATSKEAKPLIPLYVEKCRRLYNKFVKEKVEKDPMILYTARGFGGLSNSSTIHTVPILYSYNKEFINKVFMLAQKKHSLSPIIDNIVIVADRGCDITITSKIEEASIANFTDFNRIIITKEVTTADQLLELVHEVDPFNHRIGVFQCNPFLIKNIRLDEFSEGDIEKLAPHLEWNHIGYYFKNGVAPFEFLMKYERFIKNKLYVELNPLSEQYSVSQKIRVAKVFKDRLPSHYLSHIMRDIFFKDEGATEQEIVELIRGCDSITLMPNQDVKNKNLSLKSILTLI